MCVKVRDLMTFVSTNESVVLERSIGLDLVKLSLKVSVEFKQIRWSFTSNLLMVVARVRRTAFQ